MMAMSEKNSVFYPELLEDLEQHTMITEYRLQSRLFGVEGISIPSYQGHITLRMSGPQQMVNLMHMLLRFGTYSGIGIKTRWVWAAFKWKRGSGRMRTELYKS